MTRLIVLSDSHGDSDAIERVLAHEKTIGAVIYLGDGDRDMETAAAHFPGLRYYLVSGNCDFHSFSPRDAMAPFEHVIFYFTHGHIHGVKYDLTALAQAAKARGAQIALFGHTHKPYFDTCDGVTLFNPGSCGRCYVGDNTYGVLTLEDGKLISAEHLPVPKTLGNI